MCKIRADPVPMNLVKPDPFSLVLLSRFFAFAKASLTFVLVLVFAAAPEAVASWQDVTSNIPGGIPIVKNGGPLATDGTTLYVNTGDGVVWTDDGTSFTAGADIHGSSWRWVKVIDDELWTGGEINSQTSTMLWRSTDKGATWINASSGMPGEVSLGVTDDIARDPDTGTYWVGSRFGGVYRSDDGLTWTHPRVGLPFAPYYSLSIGEFVYSEGGDALVGMVGDGTIIQGGIYRTENDGATWSRLAGVPPGDPSDFIKLGGRILVTTSGTNLLNSGLYYTEDFGDSWTFQNQWLNDDLFLSSDGTLGFAVSGGAIWYTANDGLSWELFDKTGLPQGLNVYGLEKVGNVMYLLHRTGTGGEIYRYDASGYDFKVSTQVTLDPEGATIIEENGYTLMGDAVGAGTVSFQWYRDGVLVPGATSKDLVLDPIAAADEGLYTFRATAGGETVESESAYVTVKTRLIGTVDTQFKVNFGFNLGATRDVYSTLIDSDGNFWVHGEIRSSGGRMIKFDPITGAVLAEVATSATGRSLAEDSEGKIWAGTNNAWLHRVSKDGTIDFTVDINYNLGSGRVNSIAPYGDAGQVLIAGLFNKVGGVDTGPVVLLNHDGTIDSSFDVANSTLTSTEVLDVEIGPNGEIFITDGTFTTGGSRYVGKLNADGSLDEDWWLGGKHPFSEKSNISGFPNDIEVLADGSLLLGFRNAYGHNNSVITAAKSLMKVGPDGSWDSSFNEGGTGPNGEVLKISSAPDGKIVIVGEFQGYNDGGINSPNRRVTRLLSNGRVDPYWNPEGEGQRGTVYDASFDTEGNVFLGTDHTWYNGVNEDRILKIVGDVAPLALLAEPASQIVDLGEDVSFFAASFGTSAVSYQWYKDGVAIPGATSDTYDIASVGDSDDGDYSVKVSNATGGTIESSAGRLLSISVPKFLEHPAAYTGESGDTVTLGFDVIGLGDLTYQWYLGDEAIDGATESEFSIPFAAVDDTGYYHVEVTGSSGTTRSADALVLIESFAGALDRSLETGNGFNSLVSTMLDLGDGNLLVGGNFTQYSGTSKSYLAKISEEGVLDESWPAAGAPSFALRDLALLDDGKILGVGPFSQSGDWPTGIVRLDTDGVIDVSFNSLGAGFSSNSSALAVEVQEDGKYILLADTSYNGNPTYNGEEVKYLFRVNSDGSIDDTFMRVDADVMPLGIKLLSSGKVLMYGNFNTVNGESHAKIVRINSDGSIDSTFLIGDAPDGIVKSVDETTDGKIVLGGSFQNIGGYNRRYLAMLNSDGSVNEDFDSSSGSGNEAGGIIDAVSALLDGNILAAGSFLSWGGGAYTTPYRIAVVNRLGERVGFEPGSQTGFSSNPSASFIQDGPGYAYIGGNSGTYHGQSVPRFLRIHLDAMDLVFLSRPVDQFVEAGETAVFTSDVLGTTTVGYQWYKDGVPIAGATSSSLVISNAQESNEGGYHLQIVNSSGVDESDSKQLKILGRPEIVSHPLGRELGSGTGTTLVAEGLGAAPLTVQWYLNGTPIDGATSETLVLEKVLEADAGMYHAVFTNSLGSTSTRKAAVSVEYGPEGVDTNFTAEISGSAGFYRLFQESSGRYVVAGSFNFSGSRNLVKYEPNGDRVDGFYAGGYPSNGFNQNSQFGSDGSLTYFNGSSLYRLTPGNYALDATFNSNASANNFASVFNRQVKALADGKYLVSGNNALMRINNDGTADPSFNDGGAGPVGYAKVSDEASDGSIAVVGSFSSYNGGSSSYLAVLNADGSVKDSFVQGTGFNSDVTAAAFTADGSLYVGGYFSEYNGQVVDRLVRLNADGSLDTNFAPGAVTYAGSPAPPSYLTVDPDGNVYVSGIFNKIGEASVSSFALLSSTGQITEGPLGSSFYGSISDWLYEANGSITVVGAFSSPKDRMMRINAAPPVLKLVGGPEALVGTEGERLYLAASASGEGPFTFEWKKDGVVIDGETGSHLLFASLGADDRGSYVVSVSNGGDPIVADAVSLGVNVALGITNQPQDVASSQGGTASFTVVAQGSGTISYQWRMDGVDISGANSATLELAGLDSADAGLYSVYLTDDNGSLLSDAAALTVGPALSITDQPDGGLFDAGEDVTLTVVASGAGTLTYQWFKDTVEINGATQSSFSISSFAAGDAGTYSVEVSNGTVTAVSSNAAVALYVVRSASFDSYLAGLGIDKSLRSYEGDLDFDGWSNVLEYLLGSDPTEPGSVPVIETSVVEVAGLPHLYLTFNSRSVASDVTFGVQTADSPAFVSPTSAESVSTTVVSEGIERLVYRSADPIGKGETLFGRIVIE